MLLSWFSVAILSWFITCLNQIRALPFLKLTRITPPNCVCPDMPLLMKPVCGSNGRNYSDWCQFTNARFNQPSLGRVLCQNLPELSKNPSRLSSTSQPEKATKCLTNGQTVTGTRYQLYFQLQGLPGTGIRCDSACPCPVPVCPRTVRRAMDLPG